ncbi:MAG: hypothetical protein ABII27_02700 [bacterium]
MGIFCSKKDVLTMLHDQACKLEEGLMVLDEFVNRPNEESKLKIQKLRVEIEKLQERIVEESNFDSAPPFEKEDIFNFSRLIYDTIDYSNSTIEDMLLFKLESNQYLSKMVKILYESNQHLGIAIKLINLYPRFCYEYVLRAKRYADYIRALFKDALNDLSKGKDRVSEMALKEVYKDVLSAFESSYELVNDISHAVVMVD